LALAGIAGAVAIRPLSGRLSGHWHTLASSATHWAASRPGGPTHGPNGGGADSLDRAKAAWDAAASAITTMLRSTLPKFRSAAGCFAALNETLVMAILWIGVIS
jgi:hypothetical protein